VWLEDVQLEDGVVTGRFEQDLWDLDMEWPGSPPIEEIGSTSWYQQLKVPIVECRFTVREATSLDVGAAMNPAFDVEWDENERVLAFDNGVAIVCSHPNLELEATDRVVGYERLKQWRVGGLQTGGPWEGE